MIKKKEKPDTSTRWAKLLGTGIAHFQHGCDVAIDLGFKAMKKVHADNEAASEQKSTIKNEYVRNTANVVKGGIHFVGTLGDEYYQKYEELKRKHKN